MASKPSVSRKDAFQVHTTLEFRGGNTPGIIVRQGGDSGTRYLEFALPDKPRSIRVEWKSDDFCCSAAKGNKEVPVRLIVDKGTPRALTYKDGAFYEKGGSAPFVDKKAAEIGARFAALCPESGAPNRTARVARPSAVNPFGWFSCMSSTSGTGAGLGAAVGGVAGAPGGPAGAGAGAATGAGLGAAAGALFGLGWCTTNAILGVA
jgi:hypothetical protein